MTDYDDDAPYGIRPAPGACCPDQPNCKHCRPRCPKCGGEMERAATEAGGQPDEVAYKCNVCGLWLTVESDGYTWKRCSHCGAIAHLQGNLDWPHETDYWECENYACGHEEKVSDDG